MRGIKVTVVGLKDYNTLNKFRVAGALMDGNQVILDENGKPCAFTTKAKVLTDTNRTALDISRADASMMNPTKVKTVGLNEEVLFLKNLPALIAAKQNNLDIILVFQVIEAEHNDKTLLDTTTNRTMLNTTRNKTMNKTMTQTSQTIVDEDEGNNEGVKDLEEDSQKGYKIASWFAMKINNEDGSITYGRFEKPLFFEPIVKPPFDEEKLPRTETTVDFIIEEYQFDAETLAHHKKSKKGKKSKRDDPESTSRKKGPKKHEWVIDPRPFIINTKRQYIDRPFEKGNGIDFYIDGARFLPDNVTVTKVLSFGFFCLIIDLGYLDDINSKYGENCCSSRFAFTKQHDVFSYI